MQPALSESGFVLKRYGRADAGRYRLYSVMSDDPLWFIEERVEELSPLSSAHIYEDEGETQEVLTLVDAESSGLEQAVVDAKTGKKIGAIGLAVDDAGDFIDRTWTIYDVAGSVVGKVVGKSGDRPVVSVAPEFQSPQEMDIVCGGALAGRLRQKVNVVGYQLSIDFSMDAAHLLDRRLGLAAAVFAAFDKTKME